MIRMLIVLLVSRFEDLFEVSTTNNSTIVCLGKHQEGGSTGVLYFKVSGIMIVYEERQKYRSGVPRRLVCIIF